MADVVLVDTGGKFLVYDQQGGNVLIDGLLFTDCTLGIRPTTVSIFPMENKVPQQRTTGWIFELSGTRGLEDDASATPIHVVRLVLGSVDLYAIYNDANGTTLFAGKVQATNVGDAQRSHEFATMPLTLVSNGDPDTPNFDTATPLTYPYA